MGLESSCSLNSGVGSADMQRAARSLPVKREMWKGGRCEGGEKLAHEWSKSFPAYDPAETDTKLKHALAAAGPPTCSYISRNGGRETCLKCPNRLRVKSPINLGSSGAGSSSPSVASSVERYTGRLSASGRAGHARPLLWQ